MTPFRGICIRCRHPHAWVGKTADDRPPCPACGWQADGSRIDKADARIEGARESGEKATPMMFGESHGTA